MGEGKRELGWMLREKGKEGVRRGLLNRDARPPWHKYAHTFTLPKGHRPMDTD